MIKKFSQIFKQHVKEKEEKKSMHWTNVHTTAAVSTTASTALCCTPKKTKKNVKEKFSGVPD